MKIDKPTVTLTDDELLAYMELAWKTCWQTVLDEKAKPDSWFQDYVTASDMEACVRWLVDIDHDKLFFSSSWWGYGGWCRIKMADQRYKTRLLDRCREFLADLLRAGTVEGHNFGRGHCSGMRFRAKGTGLSEAEKKTIENKTKEKPVHLRVTGTLGRVLLCTKDRKRKNTYRSYRAMYRSDIRVTNEADKVTCPRCLKLMKEEKQ